jgi:hypothetical protein
MGKGNAVKLIRWLAVALLLTLPLPSVRATGWRKDIPDLAALNRHLCGKVMDHTANHGKDNRIWSRSLFQRRDLYVYLPPNYDPHVRYPFMIFLHGIAQDEHAFIHFIVPQLDEAIRCGKLPPLIVAAPDGSVHGEPCMHSPGTFFLNSCLGDFEDFILQDMWDFVCHHYSIRAEREAHILAGLSMGGFAAYNFAIKHRETFGVVVGIYPPLNLRWVDAQGNYFSDFDPENWGWRSEAIDPDEVVGRFLGGLVKVRAYHFLEPVFGHSYDGLLEMRRENPIEMLVNYCVRPCELEMYVAYGGEDQFNLTAQIDSFLYVARCRGLSVGVGFNPRGRHDMDTACKMLPGIFEWLAPRVAPYAPCRR